MKSIAIRITLLLVASMLAMPYVASAQSTASTGIFPQSSVYWNPRRPGEGIYLEVQGTRAAFIIFGYELDGSQLFYTGGGDIRSATGGEQRPFGWFPMHFLRSELTQTFNGPAHVDPNRNNPRQYETRSVGEVVIAFETQDSIGITYHLTGDVPAELPRTTLRYYSQYNFGHATLGKFGSQPETCLTDFLGEWVFVDTTNPRRSPWRFNFTGRESNIPLEEIDCSTGRLTIVTYTDLEREAVLRCVRTSTAQGDPLDGLPKTACELRLDGEPAETFWFRWEDASLGRITATLGEYPGPAHMRGPQRVLGWRVQ